MEIKNQVRGWHPIVLAVSALGIVSIILLLWMHRINTREDADLLLADAIMDLEVNVASSHFKLEESYHKRLPEESDRALPDLDRALARAKAIYSGGQSKFGPKLTVPENPQFPVKIKKIIAMLFEMKGIAVQLSHASPESPFPASLDARFDQVCDEVLENAKTLELELEKKGTAHRNESRHLVYWIFFAWSGVVAFATVGLWNKERQRRQADASLLSLNANLEIQTEELTRHREHFMELVEERTARLKLANEQLLTEMAERVEIEKALRKSEERYRTLIETMDAGLTILDEKGTLVYANDTLCKMLGRPRSDILGQPLAKFIAFDQDIQTASEHLNKIYTRDQSRFDVAFFKRDGNIVRAIASLKAVHDTGGNQKGCFAVITDITEKITLQATSRRTAHLAALGEMAAGVAHEINNPINGIINYACMLLECKNSPELEKEIAAKIQTEGRRIAGIVRDLLLFGRGGKKEKVPVNVIEVLSNTLNVTGESLRKDGIEILTSFASELPRPLIDPQELQRVFINILYNAQHALNQKYPDRHENKILQINAASILIDQTSWVRIAFKDRGTGIPAQIIDKVKQPFFSTGPRGKGTGLGLSISEGIISECGGKLTIESVEGEFTNIQIDLPGGFGI